MFAANRDIAPVQRNRMRKLSTNDSEQEREGGRR
jgi:hypothetical protein